MYFLIVDQYHAKFSRKQFYSVLHFKYVIYVQRTTNAILLVNFGLFGGTLSPVLFSPK